MTENALLMAWSGFRKIKVADDLVGDLISFWRLVKICVVFG